ncbi:MAG TPA: hypothetical protein VEI02_16355 [Planctomycetota bacterium]|nr:hypothetical protein [Planctomycetota bacterium]
MKLLKRLFVVILILVVAAGAALFFIDELAENAVERGGSYAMGVETTVDATSIGLFAGTAKVENLKIANPAGYGDAPFFTMRSLDTGVSLGSLRGEKVEIPTLAIDGVRVNLLQKDGKANYQTIIDNLKRFSSASPSSEEKSGKKFVIRELTVKNVTVSADLSLLLPLPAGQAPELRLPDLRLTNVGEGAGAGVPLSELAGVVVAAVLDLVGRGGAGFLDPKHLGDLAGRVGDLDALTAQAAGAVTDAMNRLGTDLGSKLGTQLGGQVGKDAEDALKSAGEKIGGLLGGKK